LHEEDKQYVTCSVKRAIVYYKPRVNIFYAFHEVFICHVFLISLLNKLLKLSVEELIMEMKVTLNKDHQEK